MKKLSDYSGEEAIELWAELFEPMTAILTDDEITENLKSSSKTPLIQIAGMTMKKFPKEVSQILSRIDDEEINGANILTKLIIFLTELMRGDKASAFFGSAEKETQDEESSGSATESTEDGAK